MPLETADLVGAWRLASFHLATLDGDVTYPFGKDAVGYYLFSASGYMSVMVAAANRAPFATGDVMSATVEERARAAEAFIAYTGKYELRGDTLVVCPEMSFYPNWIGVDQVRIARLDGDELDLSTQPLLLAGKQQTAHLLWRRT